MACWRFPEAWIKRVLLLRCKTRAILAAPSQGSTQPVTASVVSDSNPFIPGEDDAYERSGHAELLALQAALSGASAARPATAPCGTSPAPPPAAPGLELGAAAGAAWRRKVLLSWAPNLQELLRRRGLGCGQAGTAWPGSKGPATDDALAPAVPDTWAAGSRRCLAH